MGSLLGNYIHLSAQGYLNAGTYRDESRWNNSRLKKERKVENDFDEDIFNKYINALQKKYQSSLFSLNEQKLKTWENGYNLQRKQNYEALVRMNKEGQLPQNFFELIVSNANLGKDIDEQALIDNLTFDEKTESIDFKIKSLASQAIKITTSKASNYTQFRLVDDRFKKTEERIKEIQDVKVKEGIEKECQELKKIYEAYKDKQITLGELEEKLGLEKSGSTKHKNSLPPGVANYIIDKLNSITTVAIGANILVKLQASFAEIMGSILSQQQILETLSMDAIVETLSSAAGLNKTATYFNQAGAVIKLDYDSMKTAFDKQKKGGSNTFKQIIEVKDPGGNYHFDFNVNFLTQQKADFTLRYGGKTIGVSMKNTDMSKDFYIDKKTNQIEQSVIKLQEGTSLYAFLLGIQKDKIIKNIHNHFLNVFSQEPNKLGDIRKQASNAMILSLLYSSLSGKGLGKIEGFADILAIEDKNEKIGILPKVRFYNITSILNNIASNIEQNKINLQYSPNFDIFTLKNDWQVTVKKRITNLLLQARGTQLSMAINKSYLNKIYKN